jgi:hypothetical protein
MAIAIAISSRLMAETGFMEHATLGAYMKAINMMPFHNAPSACVRAMRDAFIDLAQYHAIVAVTMLSTSQSHNVNA